MFVEYCAHLMIWLEANILPPMASLNATLISSDPDDR